MASPRSAAHASILLGAQRGGPQERRLGLRRHGPPGAQRAETAWLSQVDAPQATPRPAAPANRGRRGRGLEPPHLRRPAGASAPRGPQPAARRPRPPPGPTSVPRHGRAVRTRPLPAPRSARGPPGPPGRSRPLSRAAPAVSTTAPPQPSGGWPSSRSPTRRCRGPARRRGPPPRSPAVRETRPGARLHLRLEEASPSGPGSRSHSRRLASRLRPRRQPRLFKRPTEGGKRPPNQRCVRSESRPISAARSPGSAPRTRRRRRGRLRPEPGAPRWARLLARPRTVSGLRLWPRP